MTRHRITLIALGTLQLLAAGVLFMFWFGANIKGVEHRTWETTETIAGGLRTAGVGVPAMASGQGSAAFEAIARPVRSEIWASESRAKPSILAVGVFGAITLLAGLIPQGRRRHTHEPGANRPADP